MHNILSFFQNRQLIIATKHKKETVIAPLAEKSLGVTTFVPGDFDTDLLGTFTGEIEREADPVSTVRNKCLQAMDKYNCDLGIASEGSFGAHPVLFFGSADEEWVIFIDKKNNLEILERKLSISTNFNGREIKTEQELRDFASQSLFPSHGLILRDCQNSHKTIIKGITDWQTLLTAYHDVMQSCGTVFAETDMRAMYNPTRMQVIKEASQKLMDKISSPCPACGTPGFGITNVITGLPCSNCHVPTESVLSHIYTCISCGYTNEKKYPHQKTFEEPMYCQNCNP